MRTELLGQEKNIVTIKLEIEAGEFTKALNKTLSELSTKANIPGFRKGKTPRKILEMRFGRDAIYNEALEKLMPDYIRQIVDDYDLDPIETPTLDVKDRIEEGKDVHCEIVFEVRPEVELPEIDGLEIEKVITEVNDEAVDSLEKRIRLQMADIKPVERPVNDGDIVDVELLIRTLNDDGSEAPESDQPRPEATHEKIDLSDQTIRQQVREALVGKSKGEEVFASFDVEAGHGDRALAGKKVSYKMKIENVSEYILPEMNEDFYKKVFGPDTEIKDVAAFRERLRQDITGEVEEENRRDLQDRTVELVAGKSKVEIPDKFIERQIHAMRHEDEHWAKDNGITVEQAYGLDTEEGRNGYEKLLRDRAVAAVKNVLVMDEAAKKYDVHLEQEDVEAEFERRAKQLNVSKGFVAKFFYENKQQLDRLTDELRWSKIADVLLSHMSVKEVKELSQPEDSQNSQEQNN